MIEKLYTQDELIRFADAFRTKYNVSKCDEWPYYPVPIYVELTGRVVEWKPESEQKSISIEYHPESPVPGNRFSTNIRLENKSWIELICGTQFLHTMIHAPDILFHIRRNEGTMCKIQYTLDGKIRTQKCECGYELLVTPINEQKKIISVVVDYDCPNDFWYSEQRGKQFDVKKCQHSDLRDVECLWPNKPDDCWKVADGEFAGNIILKSHCQIIP